MKRNPALGGVFALVVCLAVLSLAELIADARSFSGGISGQSDNIGKGVTFTLPAAGQVKIDADATDTTDNALFIDCGIATNGKGCILVDFNHAGGNPLGIGISNTNVTAIGSGEEVAGFFASMEAHASDNASALRAAYSADNGTDGGGREAAFLANSNWENALLMKSGNIEWEDVAATIRTSNQGGGVAENFSIDHDDAAGGGAGGTLTIEGSDGNGGGADGNIIFKIPDAGGGTAGFIRMQKKSDGAVYFNITEAGAISIGGDGATIQNIMHGTCAIDPAEIAAGAVATSSCTAADTTSDSRVFMTAPSALEDDLILAGADPGTGSITVAIRNLDGASAVNGASRTWHWMAIDPP